MDDATNRQQWRPEADISNSHLLSHRVPGEGVFRHAFVQQLPNVRRRVGRIDPSPSNIRGQRHRPPRVDVHHPPFGVIRHDNEPLRGIEFSARFLRIERRKVERAFAMYVIRLCCRPAVLAIHSAHRQAPRSDRRRSGSARATSSSRWSPASGCSKVLGVGAPIAPGKACHRFGALCQAKQSERRVPGAMLNRRLVGWAKIRLWLVKIRST